MMEVKKQKKKSTMWDARAFRRKCIRLIAYIYVFFMVLNRRLSVGAKKWLSVSFCGCVVAVVMVLSMAGQEKAKVAGKEMPVVSTLSENHNRVTAGQTEVSIELNRSRVTGDESEIASTESGEKENGDADAETVQGGGADADAGMDAAGKAGRQKNMVISDTSNTSGDASGDQPNKVTAESEVLFPVQALLKNHGKDKQDQAMEMYYQYPAEIGDDEKKNDRRLMSASNYIKGVVYDIDEEGIAEGETVSPGAVSQAAVQIEENSVSDVKSPAASGSAFFGAEESGIKDAAVPAPVFYEGGYLKIQGKDKTIFCTNDNKIRVVIPDGAEGVRVEKMCYMYGDNLRYCVTPSQNMELEVPENFYGRVTASCFDAADNRSEPLSEYVLVENQAPHIRFSQDAFCTAPYTFWVDIREKGSIVSGIRDVTCMVDGKRYVIKNLAMFESTLLDEGLEVPSGCEFSIPFTEEGTHSVVVTVTDHAGNTATEETVVRVTKPELISVFMPEKFTIHIDPQQLAGREQIYSDEITLKNDSDFDVQVTVKKVEVIIKDEGADTGRRKDCEMYMIAPDTGEKISLKKGENKDVYSYCIKKGEGDAVGKLRFVGDTSKGSDELWKDSDVTIHMELGFSKQS